jgi:hypothetical protein
MAHGNTGSTGSRDGDQELLQADAIVPSSSGGKDSILAILETLDVTDALGIPRDRITVVHADMGRLEHRAATAADQVPAGYSELQASDLAEAQADALGLAFVRVSNPREDLMANWSRKGENSRVGARNCQGTSDFKRTQIWKVYTAIAKEWRERTGETRPCRIVEVWGLAGHESDARRERLAKFDRDARGWAWKANAACSNSRRTVTTVCPLADVESDQVVFEKCRKAELETGVPTLHWIYSTGLPRLSCSFCVFMSRDLMILSGKLNPELLAELAEDEKTWSRPWSSKFTLVDVLEAVQRGEDVNDLTWGNQS